MVTKMNDKKTAKLYGVVTFPGLTFFKAGKAVAFEGDLSNGEAILDFLVSQDSLDIPDRIEQVNAKQLEKLIEKKEFIAICFCKLSIFWIVIQIFLNKQLPENCR